MAEGTCSIEGCDQPTRARGWCRRHYLRWHKTGDPMGTLLRPPVNPDERFWSKVARGDVQDCWLWTGGKNPAGYGRMNVGTSRDSSRVELAHRLAWTWHTGIEIPEGLVVLHLCDVRACCNPHHLVLGTHQANIADMVRKDRQKGAHDDDALPGQPPTDP